MSRRGKIRLTSYLIYLMAVMIAALAACHVGAGRYTTRLDAHCSRAFGEAISAVGRLHRSLEACAYASDAPMQSALCTQLYADANAAETALSALPVEEDALEQISRHISVAGDYAYLLSRTAANGTLFSPDEYMHLKDFLAVIDRLSERLSSMREEYTRGELFTEHRARLTDALDNLEEDMEKAADTLDAAFHETAASFPEQQPFVYDGMFGDHSQDKSRLHSMARVSQEQARAAAASFLRCDLTALEPLGLSGGDLPCWRFSHQKTNTVIAVTLQGGEVLRFLTDAYPSGELSFHEAEAIGKAFLNDRGFSDLALVQTSSAGNDVVLTFVPQSNGVLFLPDGITVKISGSAGDVTAYDASGYLQHHMERVFPSEIVSWTPPNGLTVEMQRNIFLLSPGGQERPCVEYLCRNEAGELVRVAVRADTGLQERILLGDARGDAVD